MLPRGARHGHGQAAAAGAWRSVAVERDCGRFEWSVLDWNVDAQAFYQRMGATLLPDLRICRVTGDPLQALGCGVSVSSER